MVTIKEIEEATEYWKKAMLTCQWKADRPGIDRLGHIDPSVMAYIERLEQRIEDLEQLVNAVTCGEFSGISCQDIMVDGKLVNWFDQQAALQGKGTR